ncbi:hypothetical protein [Deinococcus peraridilitoris]|uniref:DUF1440 domain-containing protein n=1 Tax=Deinococcus peraridilitoris (strain DSM 19664 / LMG 22246 / CIP 109416 / KR-200) TaxID=937777 RepID=L0A7Z1_DEIPD|nr:hypothetical protein [Deinococcus peraridilitoris]AFZ69302.1 hypothetical protein Deipe_3887 [Deinococcus peraridilitoris DSM 19664]
MSTAKSRPALHQPRYTAGLLASLSAETAFILINALASALQGNSPWMVVRVPAVFMVGPDALEPAGFAGNDVLLGLFLHLVMSAAVGLVFAWLSAHLTISPVALGLVTAAVLFFFGFWLLPTLFPLWLSPFALSPKGMLVQTATHVVYGVVFGAAYRQLSTPRAHPG